jgi:TetR/AcrR family transcriptional repressor of nem operon
MSLAVKQRLLEVGLEAIRQGGFSAVSIKELVTQAEVPKGSFHYYFESKEAYGAELVDHYIHSVKAQAEPILHDLTLTPLQRLRVFFQSFSYRMQEGGYKAGCLVGVMAAEAWQDSPLLREKTGHCLSLFPEFLSPFISEAQQQGEIRSDLSVRELAEFIADCWQGVLLRMKVQQDGAALQSFDKVIFEHFLPVV